MVKLLRGKIYRLEFHRGWDLLFKDETFTHTQLNYNLNKISKWPFQWKMLFNPDPSKQAMEICFSHKRDNKIFPSLMLNNTKSNSLLARNI